MNTLKNLKLVGYSKEYNVEDVLMALAFRVSLKNEVLPAFTGSAGCFWGKFLEHFDKSKITQSIQEEIFTIEHTLFERKEIRKQKVLILREELREQASTYYSYHRLVILGLSRWLRMYNQNECYAIQISTRQAESVKAETRSQLVATQ